MICTVQGKCKVIFLFERIQGGVDAVPDFIDLAVLETVIPKSLSDRDFVTAATLDVDDVGVAQVTVDRFCSTTDNRLRPFVVDTDRPRRGRIDADHAGSQKE